MAAQAHDPRIADIEELAATEGRPLALRPETICALEDIGYLVDPFTATMTRDPDRTRTHEIANLFDGMYLGRGFTIYELPTVEL